MDYPNIFKSFTQDEQIQFLTQIRQGISQETYEILDEIGRITRERDFHLQGAKKEHVETIKSNYGRDISELEEELSFLKKMEKQVAKDPLAAMKSEEYGYLFKGDFERFLADKQSKIEPTPKVDSQTVSDTAKESFKTKAEKSSPDLSETKVENTKADYRHKNESHNTQTTNPPPAPPNSKPSEPKPKVKDTLPQSNAPKTGVPDTVKASKFLKANRGRIIAGAAGVGIAKAVLDGDDDDMLSAAGKSIKTAAVVGGLSYGAEHLLKTQTVQDLVRGEASDISKSVRKSGDMKRKATFKAGKIGTALKIGLGVVGTAAAVDAVQRYGDHRGAEKMKREQEYRLKQKEKKKKKKQKEYAYGSMEDTGQIVLDLFEARTGHHKMGNAKFY